MNVTMFLLLFCAIGLHRNMYSVYDTNHNTMYFKNKYRENWNLHVYCRIHVCNILTEREIHIIFYNIWHALSIFEDMLSVHR